MKSNTNLIGLVEELKKHSIEHGVGLWKRVAMTLENTSQNKRIVNLYKIEKTARDGEIVLVPGKVLAVGELTKPVRVAAFNFSQQAEEKIKKAKGNVYTIHQIMKENPKGKKIRLMG